MVKVKNRLTLPNVGKDMEQSEFSYTAGKSINSTTTLINYLSVSYKIKHTPA